MTETPRQTKDAVVKTTFPSYPWNMWVSTRWSKNKQWGVEGKPCVVQYSGTCSLRPHTHTAGSMVIPLLLSLKQRSGINQWQVVDFHLHVYSCAQVISLPRSGNYSYPRAQNSPSVWKRRIRSSRGHSDNLLDNTNIIIITFCCLHVCLILFMTEIQFQLNKTINFFWLLHRYNLE